MDRERAAGGVTGNRARQIVGFGIPNSTLKDNIPTMLTCPSVHKRVIRSHYNLITPFYWLLWGPHIHHGLWDADETPREAQLQDTEGLETLSRIDADQQMLKQRVIDSSG